MLNLVMFFIVIIAWLIYNILWFRKRKRRSEPSPDMLPDYVDSRKPLRGKRYAWTWMQAAGALQLKFIRPDSANGYPAIEGTHNGISVMVQCQPSAEGLTDSTLFRFHFPCPAELDLEMFFSDDPESVTKLAGNRKSVSMQYLFSGRQISHGFLQVRDPEILRCCMSSDCLDHLARLSLIYPVVRLTDSELTVRSNGINNDLQSFRDQLKNLLETASMLGIFAEKAVARKAQTIAVTESQLANAAPDCRPETEPDPEPEQKPQPETPEADTLEKNAFIRRLWSSGMNFQKQKEFFESCRGREVEWEGILKLSFPFSSDFVFGNNAGVKATFELAEFKPEGSFMPVRIKAVAAFSREASELFAKASGKHFRFRGRLLKIEPVAREIYLSDGVITETES